MCPSPSSSPKTAYASTIVDRIVCVCLFLYTFPGFAFFRGGEIGSLISCYKNECISVLIGTTIIGLSLRTRRAKNLLHFISLILLVYVLDVYVTKPLPVPNESYENKTIVITGSNAGVGYETARQLAVDYGMNVIMGCRSEAKCNNAADSIKNEIVLAKSSGDVTPYIIDLSNLDSVGTFSSQIQMEGRKIDVLFNNAGYVPGVGQPVNEYGLDPAFTSMHLAHFYLTELLLKENPNMRVVNTSSGTHHMCAMPLGRSLAPRVIRDHPGCLDEKYLKTGIRSETDEAAYYQSKIANVMHAVEIPRNHPQATAVAIDLGWVGTSIQSFMTFSVSPVSLGWMRSARIGVLPMIHAILSSDDELMNGVIDEKKGVLMNVFGQPAEAFTTMSWWKGDVSKERMEDRAGKLWEESVKLLQELGVLSTQ